MKYNQLPHYFMDEVHSQYYNTEIDNEEKEEIKSFLDKAKFLIGSIVVSINSLEKCIEDCIMELMNEKGDDERVWVFLENMSFFNKIITLSKLYDLRIINIKNEEKIKINKEKFFKEIDNIRLKRNIYIHSDWLNFSKNKYIEEKVKRVKDKGYHRIFKKISLTEMKNDLEIIDNLEFELYDLHEDIV